MKRLITGIKPTGIITLGNYIGAIKTLIKLQQELTDTEIFVFIADVHAITVYQKAQELRNNIKTLAAMYLACGLDISKARLFIQSEVPAHTQLSFVMECTGHIGELERMTQFKDKRAKMEKNISVGLLTYPALMAADILLYDADIVPVGEDQKQHLELTRDLAERFNKRFGETFTIPEPYIPKVGAKILSLTDPTKKMSKTDDNPKSYINMLDDPNIIKKRIKSAVTDLDGKVHFDPENKPGISNLMTIYSSFTDLSYLEIEEKYINIGYQVFKDDLAEIVACEIQEIQTRFKEIISSNIVDQYLDEGRDYVNMLASRKIKKVYDKVGLGRKQKK